MNRGLQQIAARNKQNKTKKRKVYRFGKIITKVMRYDLDEMEA